uniref:Glycine-rich RNA-binding protein 8 n=1 Tax=Nicotiana tabacum TaxID=4097 RepID=A0A1S4CFI6_TOBAC|nr:PREDICTED: glycine-rich RNA-binding protein 8-like [Nicotiana tabacum]
MGSKTFMVLAISLAIFVITSEVAARELAGSSNAMVFEKTNAENDAKLVGGGFPGFGGGGFPGFGGGRFGGYRGGGYGVYPGGGYGGYPGGSGGGYYGGYPGRGYGGFPGGIYIYEECSGWLFIQCVFSNSFFCC